VSFLFGTEDTGLSGRFDGDDNRDVISSRRVVCSASVRYICCCRPVCGCIEHINRCRHPSCSLMRALTTVQCIVLCVVGVRCRKMSPLHTWRFAFHVLVINNITSAQNRYQWRSQTDYVTSVKYRFCLALSSVHTSNNVEATLSNATNRTILSTKSKQICFDFVEKTNFFSELELMFTFAICYRPSVCRMPVTFVHPTQFGIFGNISTPFGTLAILWHSRIILRRSSQENPSVGGGGLNARGVDK